MTFWDFLCAVLMVVFGAALFILFLPIILIVLLVCIIFS